MPSITTQNTWSSLLECDWTCSRHVCSLWTCKERDLKDPSWLLWSHGGCNQRHDSTCSAGHAAASQSCPGTLAIGTSFCPNSLGLSVEAKNIDETRVWRTPRAQSAVSREIRHLHRPVRISVFFDLARDLRWSPPVRAHDASDLMPPDTAVLAHNLDDLFPNPWDWHLNDLLNDPIRDAL